MNPDMNKTTAEPTEADSRSWLDRQRAIHTDIPDELGNDEKPAPDGGGGLLNALREVVGAPVKMTCGGRTILIGEPRVRTLKRLIARADVMKAQADSEDSMAAMEELQRVMLDCVEFHDEAPAPDDVCEWFDDLGISEAARLVESFQRVINLRALMDRAKVLSGGKR